MVHVNSNWTRTKMEQYIILSLFLDQMNQTTGVNAPEKSPNQHSACSAAVIV